MTARTLVLVRHAKARGSSGSGDRDRPLTPEGTDQARRLGRRLAAELGAVDVAVTSPALRARQTLEAILESVGAGRCCIDDAVYMSGAEDLVDVARELDGSASLALMVGHEPSVSSVAAALAATREDRDQVTLGVPTGTAMVLRFEGPWEDLAEGTCDLEVLHEPVRPA